jgi:two-component system, chemotaxis family, chemotaxis protein CheY
MKILVVDDSKPMRMIVKKTLRDAGFGGHEISEAANGREGLEALHREAFDVVLCDWNMPEMSGLELLQAVRAESTPAMREQASSAGAEFLIGKPFTVVMFQEILGGVLAA